MVARAPSPTLGSHGVRDTDRVRDRVRVRVRVRIRVRVRARVRSPTLGSNRSTPKGSDLSLSPACRLGVGVG